jgi:hypothetical protein
MYSLRNQWRDYVRSVGLFPAVPNLDNAGIILYEQAHRLPAYGPPFRKPTDTPVLLGECRLWVRMLCCYGRPDWQDHRCTRSVPDAYRRNSTRSPQNPNQQGHDDRMLHRNGVPFVAM